MFKIFSVMLFTVALAKVSFAHSFLNSTEQTDMKGMNEPNPKMYLNVGAGLGKASNWTKNSFTMNAMTMGMYMKKNVGVEIGMSLLPDGKFFGMQAQMMTYHIAAKGIFSLSKLLSGYGKLGIGATVGMGEKSPPPSLMGMTTSIGGGPYYGVGVKFNLFRRFAIYIEDSGVVVVPNGTYGRVNMTTIGIELSM